MIDLGVYDLYKVYSSPGNIDPYKSVAGIYTENWNTELIFARAMTSSWWFQHTVPRGTGTYGVFSASQNQVDAFAMSNGRYPITGYNSNGDPIVDPVSGYSESGFRNFTNQMNTRNQTVSTYEMYCDREPRFYANIIWNKMGYPYPSSRTRVQFYYNGNSGPGASHDYPAGGYLIRKAQRNDIDPENSKWNTSFSWVIVRLGEIYLNYVEALIESNPSSSDLFTYWNLIRKRAGLDDIETVYPEAVGNQAKMRELLRNERRVELCFESKRYFDTRRWQIAEETDGGNIYGMNIMSDTDAEVAGSGYWSRRFIEKRVFEKKHYLYPITLAETEKNKALVQNYGW